MDTERVPGRSRFDRADSGDRHEKVGSNRLLYSSLLDERRLRAVWTAGAARTARAAGTARASSAWGSAGRARTTGSTGSAWSPTATLPAAAAEHRPHLVALFVLNSFDLLRLIGGKAERFLQNGRWHVGYGERTAHTSKPTALSASAALSATASGGVLCWLL